MKEANFMVWNYTIASIGGIYLTYRTADDYVDEIRTINEKSILEVGFIPVYEYLTEYWQEIYDFLTTNDKFISKLCDYNKMHKYILKISEDLSRDRAISKEEFLKDQELWEELITNYNLDLDLFGFTNGISFIDSYGIENKLNQFKQLSYESEDMLEHKKLYFIQ